MPTRQGGGGIGDLGGASGAAGAAGANGEDCASVEPALEGWWTSDCNGYSCKMYIAASGDLSAGCSNGQFELGAVEANGDINTLGEGGPYAAYSTKGTLTRNDGGSLTRDYVGQIPPNTGPEQQYSCEVTRFTACAPTLLEALVGCSSFLMPYTWQMPPNEGAKHSSQCEYTRHEDQ